MASAVELSCSPLTALRLHVAAAIGRFTGSSATFSGSYERWQDAQAASGGYDQLEILDKVAAATAKVVRGEAAFERDSVTFAEPEYSPPVLSALLRAAAGNDGRTLTVLDFGGALGSSYYQCRPFLPKDCDVRWAIVEQDHFVARGRAEFETDHLQFFSGIDEAAARTRPDLVLLSSVLQYVPEPYEILRALPATGARYVLIDRTPLSAVTDDRITVQRTAPWIYSARYPCRIFSSRRLSDALASQWTILAEFPSIDGWAIARGGCFRFGGMLLEGMQSLKPSSA